MFAANNLIAGSCNYLGAEEGPGTIVVGSHDFKIYGLNAKTGEKRWAYRTENYINGTPAVQGGSILVGGCDNNLYQLDNSGKLKKSTDLDSYIPSSVASNGKVAYVGTYQKGVFAVDLKSGKILWNYKKRKTDFFSSPAFTEKYVLIGARDQKLYCLDASNGKELWTYRTGGDVDSSPVIAGDKVIFGSNDGAVYIVDLKTGLMKLVKT